MTKRNLNIVDDWQRLSLIHHYNWAAVILCLRLQLVDKIFLLLSLALVYIIFGGGGL